MKKLTKKSFIVSCQALEDEPLHSPFIMSKMALAAQMGGADAIRANGIADIQEIKKETSLPIIGIIKKDYPDSKVYITSTIDEITALVNEGVDIIALDATERIRPNKVSLPEFYQEIKNKFPNQLLMADCSTYSEMQNADALGFDYIGTTLFGYTDYSTTSAFENIKCFEDNIKDISADIIAEGQINSPQMAGEIMNIKQVHCLVVGGAITRPQNITKAFRKEIGEYHEK